VLVDQANTTFLVKSEICADMVGTHGTRPFDVFLTRDKNTLALAGFAVELQTRNECTILIDQRLAKKLSIPKIRSQ
jgi:hypothetical protein